MTDPETIAASRALPVDVAVKPRPLTEGEDAAEGVGRQEPAPHGRPIDPTGCMM